MSPGKIRFLYALYIVFVTAFFIYWLFPDRAVRSYLNFRLNAARPDFTLTATRAKPTLPPGLKLEKMIISYNNLPIIELAEFTLGTALTSLFSPGNTLLFQGDLYGGTVTGRFDRFADEGNPAVKMNSTLSGIQIGSSAVLERLVKRKISGFLEGTVQFESSKSKAGVTTSGIILSDCKIEMLASLFGIEYLSFKTISADIAVVGKLIRIRTGAILGDQMDGKFDGTIEIKAPVSKSILNLSGSIRPHHKFLMDMRKKIPVNVWAKKRTDTGEFPIQLAGTLDSPVFSLN